jgi:microcystin-dependent protein
VPGSTISSSAVNSDFSDMATALTGSIAADGQTPITGPLKLINGTAAIPALTFINDPDTGMYLASVGHLGFAAAGAATIDLDGAPASDNILSYANGAVPCPVGSIMDWPGASAPTGWLLLYGQVVSQATYPGLYLVVGTSYNTGGEGAGNFRLPDSRGRVSAGKDNMGGSAAGRITTAGSSVDGLTLGANGGAQNVTLDVTMIPSHTHVLTDPTHLHTSLVSTGNTTGVAGGGGFSTTPGNTSAAATGITIANTGGGASHLNVQPTIIFNKIIFAGR